MKLNFKKLTKEAKDEYYEQKYKGFCKDILGYEIYIQYLKSEEGQNAVGKNLAEDKLARVEGELKNVLAEKEYFEKFIGLIK